MLSIGNPKENPDVNLIVDMDTSLQTLTVPVLEKNQDTIEDNVTVRAVY